MAEGFDDLEMNDFNIDRPGDYDLDQLDNYYDETLEEKNELYGKHGDNLGTSKSVRVKYKELDKRLRVIDKERNRLKERESGDRGRSRKDSRDYSETFWIDRNIDHKRADLYVVRNDGAKDNLLYFINDFVSKIGEVNKSLTEEHKAIAARFLKSYLAISDGDGVRPLLNNHYGFELLKDTTFLRSGNIPDASLSSALKYRGVEVREISVAKGTKKKTK